MEPDFSAKLAAAPAACSGGGDDDNDADGGGGGLGCRGGELLRGEEKAFALGGAGVAGVPVVLLLARLLSSSPSTLEPCCSGRSAFFFERPEATGAVFSGGGIACVDIFVVVRGYQGRFLGKWIEAITVECGDTCVHGGSVVVAHLVNVLGQSYQTINKGVRRDRVGVVRAGCLAFRSSYFSRFWKKPTLQKHFWVLYK